MCLLDRSTRKVEPVKVRDMVLLQQSDIRSVSTELSHEFTWTCCGPFAQVDLARARINLTHLSHPKVYFLLNEFLPECRCVRDPTPTFIHRSFAARGEAKVSLM